MSSKRGSRGNSRRSARADQSSSEYSSPVHSDAPDSPPMSRRPPQGAMQDSPLPGGYETADDDDERYARDYHARKRGREEFDEEQAYATSEAELESDGRGEEREEEEEEAGGVEGEEEEEEEEEEEGVVTEEVVDSAQDEAEQEEVDDDALRRGGQNRMGGNSETEDESEDGGQSYAAAIRRSNDKAASERRSSPWGKCHPVVKQAMRILAAKGADASELGYVRLAGAGGRGALDYLVRKQSIVIGRAGHADCGLKSEGRLVSRRHARLWWHQRNREWVLTCLSKKNCVQVNGVAVVAGSTPMPVKSRDLVEVGDVPFFFLAATTPVFSVNDIQALERTMIMMRKMEGGFGGHDDIGSYGASYYGDQNSRRYGPMDNLRYSTGAGQLPPSTGRSNKRGLSKRPSASLGKNADGSSRPKKKLKGKRKKNSMHGSRGKGQSDVDPEQTEDEVQPGHEGSPQQAAGTGTGGGQSKRRYISENPPQSIERKRKIDDAREKGEHESDDEEGTMLKRNWNKKERTDFTRALFAVGVDPVFAEDGAVELYDWTRFRRISELSKKTDDELEDYYLRVMADVNTLLEEEEQEKRTKGPRTKHKAGCDCIVCKNTRKSRRKKQEELELEGGDDRVGIDSDFGDDGDVKSTAKTNGRLVGLVTAQKLRVRIGIHDAAREVGSEAGKTVLEKFGHSRDHPVKDLPSWWVAGYHDKALMKGTARHGVGQWRDIWHDSKLKPFRKEREHRGDDIKWPTVQAAMKRVRDIASSINAELRREAKRSARDSQFLARAPARLKARRDAYKAAQLSKKKAQRRKEFVERGRSSADEYEDDEAGRPIPRKDREHSTTESGSDNNAREKIEPAQTETEEEEEDMEVEVEVEEEEEMEIEEEGDPAETEDEDENTTAARDRNSKPSGPAGAISSDEEDEMEDAIQYESESGSDSE